MPFNVTDRSCAAAGLTSYRYRGRFGWIMIGAKDNDEALREAQRSTDEKVVMSKLQVWRDDSYVTVVAGVE